MKKYHLPVYKLPKGYRLSETSLLESETGNDPCMEWFRTFKDDYAAVRAGWPEDLARQPQSVFEKLYGDMFPEEIRPRMRLVGKGTTRIVFVSDSNVCFKFQYNDWNSQSQKEIAEALEWPDLKCFPKLLDYSKDGMCMAYEVAEEPTLDEFKNVFTQSPSWISDRLQEYARDGESRMLDMMLDSGLLNAEQEKAFRDLMKFQRTMFDRQGRCLYDIDHADNWGVMMRNGQRVIVVTDFGV